MKTDEIRIKFLDFFKSKGHKIVASDTLIPQNDPSVLFTSAGMNQFKGQFMGNISDFRRAATCQKCLRTGDLENVGRTPSHHTFFEMLGNFSFGDYFKEEAISWAWEFVTKTIKLPKDKLWISVHKNDAEAYDIWLKKIGVPQEKIVKLGDKDNFWPANAPKDGPNGPCGPCSEIFYDWTDKYGCKKPDCSPACSCGRFSEIWNLVFTQYDRRSDGNLSPLPSKNIDTGMGLERIASVMQNVRENYQIDVFTPILRTLEKELEKENIKPANEWFSTKAKTIADHIRAATFAIADGVIPSNETRGYVIRKLIRRSIINLKNAGVKKPFCYKLVHTISEAMKQPYPELLKRHETIAGIIKKEEEMFWLILNERSSQTDMAFKELVRNFSNISNDTNLTIRDLPSMAAHLAFTEYDTYGVPLEMSKEIAQKYDLQIHDETFEKEMDKQRNRSRSKTQISSEIFTKGAAHLIKGLSSEFIGYAQLENQAKVTAILKAKELVDQASENEEVDLILDKTAFYAEAGGQCADKGEINGANFHAKVLDVQKLDQAILHKIKVLKGTAQKGDIVLASVDKLLRQATARNHTATHLLQSALRSLIGSHIEQAGSYVCGERLRFDFTHLSALPKETIKKIEQAVNALIMENKAVKTQLMKLDEAKDSGALAFFQEKYAQQVRVVSIEGRSRELCGGTHVRATGEIGFFKITQESSVAQGIRRIEAITGYNACALAQQQEGIIAQLSAALKTSPEKLCEAAEKMSGQIKTLEKELGKFKLNSLDVEAKSLIDKADTICGVKVIITQLENYDIDSMRKMSDKIKISLDPVISILSTTNLNTKPALLVSLSQSLTNKGLDAVKIIREITAVSGGSGGGKKDLAQAGMKDSSALHCAMEKCKEIIKKFLG